MVQFRKDKKLQESRISYCGDAVRTHDPDRFFMTMLMPEETRAALWALLAFNTEIAKTREVVKEPMLGLIRLQWWREEIGKIYEGQVPPEHEVLKPLSAAIETYGLRREYLETLIHAREFDLENRPPETIDGLLNYADFTSTPLAKLAVQITGGDPDVELVQPIAVNYALMGILRAVIFHAQFRRCMLPADVMKKHGITEAQIYDGQVPPAAAQAAGREIAGYFVPAIRPENPFLKATQTMADLYAGQLRRNRFDFLSPRLRIPPFFKELRLVVGARF